MEIGLKQWPKLIDIEESVISSGTETCITCTDLQEEHSLSEIEDSMWPCTLCFTYEVPRECVSDRRQAEAARLLQAFLLQ